MSSTAKADRVIEGMANAVYAALNKQITFESAGKILREGRCRLDALSREQKGHPQQ